MADNSIYKTNYINNNKTSYIDNTYTKNIVNFQNYNFEPKRKSIIFPSILIIFFVIVFAYLSGIVAFGGGSYKHPDGSVRTENTISPDVVTNSIEFTFGTFRLVSKVNIIDDVLNFVGFYANKEVEGSLVDFASNWFTKFLQEQINSIRESVGKTAREHYDKMARWWRELVGIEEKEN